MNGGFEDQPATKRDLAETKEELSGDIHRVEAKVDKLETKVDTLTTEVRKGNRNLEELLKGPEGIVSRLEQVEKRVGLKA